MAKRQHEEETETERQSRARVFWPLLDLGLTKREANRLLDYFQYGLSLEYSKELIEKMLSPAKARRVQAAFALCRGVKENDEALRRDWFRTDNPGRKRSERAKREHFWMASVPVYGNYELRCIGESEEDAKECVLDRLASFRRRDQYWQWDDPEEYWEYAGGYVRKYTLGKSEMV